MYVGDDERLQGTHISFAQVGRPDQFYELIDFLFFSAVGLSQGVVSIALDCLLELQGPFDLVDSQHDLLRPCKDPLGLINSVVLLRALGNIASQTISHLELNVGEPVFNCTYLPHSGLDDSRLLSSVRR